MYSRSGTGFSTQCGRGSEPIWLGNVLCTGNETTIDQCRHDGWGVAYDVLCGYIQDMAVICDSSKCLLAQFFSAEMLLCS